MATIKELFDEFNTLFTEYTEYMVDGMPDHEKRGGRMPIAVRSVPANYIYENDDSRVVFKVPELEGPFGNIYSTIPVKSVQYRLNYNVITETWLLSYYPERFMGFEIKGSNLRKVLESAISVVKKSLAFERGDAEVWAEDIDHELATFITNRKGKDVWV